MISIKKITFCTLLLFSTNQILAANIDFQAINNNVANNCASIKRIEDSKNQNELLPLQPVASGEDPCKNIKTDNKYIEPKFSTKRPRGQ